MRKLNVQVEIKQTILRIKGEQNSTLPQESNAFYHEKEKEEKKVISSKHFFYFKVTEDYHMS